MTSVSSLVSLQLRYKESHLADKAGNLLVVKSKGFSMRKMDYICQGALWNCKETMRLSWAWWLPSGECFGVQFLSMHFQLHRTAAWQPPVKQAGPLLQRCGVVMISPILQIKKMRLRAVKCPRSHSWPVVRPHKLLFFVFELHSLSSNEHFAGHLAVFQASLTCRVYFSLWYSVYYYLQMKKKKWVPEHLYSLPR